MNRFLRAHVAIMGLSPPSYDCDIELAAWFQHDTESPWSTYDGCRKFRFQLRNSLLYGCRRFLFSTCTLYDSCFKLTIERYIVYCFDVGGLFAGGDTPQVKVGPVDLQSTKRDRSADISKLIHIFGLPKTRGSWLNSIKFSRQLGAFKGPEITLLKTSKFCCHLYPVQFAYYLLTSIILRVNKNNLWISQFGARNSNESDNIYNPTFFRIFLSLPLFKCRMLPWFRD